ncbi:MAG: hypothetical protein ABJC19_09945 [Gemmatimonadota bacterium]
MKGLIRGAAGLAVLLAMSACANDATIDLMGPPTGVQATPTKAFTLKGDSVAILVRLVNDRNQAIASQFDVANVGAAISVAYDAAYRPDYATGGGTLQAPLIKPEQRYFAKGLALGTSTFNLTSNGLTQTVTVTVSPKTLEAALNKTTGLTYGDTVTITAPAGLKFTPTSAVTFATGPSSIASRSADSSSIKVVLGPGTGGVATVTNVLRAYAPTTPLLTLVTTNAVVTTPTLTNIGPALSATAGLVAGSVVTITAPAGLVFSQTSVVTFPTGAIAIQSRAADSTSITIVIGPGTSGPATITKVGIVKAPAVGVFTVVTTNSVALVPSVTVAPTTVSNLTPDIGQSITVTLGGGLRFTKASQVLIGGRKAGIISTSADSSTATIMPMSGSTGVVSYSGIALSFLNTVLLTVPGDKSVTVSAVFAGPSNPLSNVLATAPTLTLTGSQSLVVTEGGTIATPCGLAAVLGADATCRFYKVTVTAAAMSGQLLWDAPANRDLGIYVLNSTGTACLNFFADDNGRQSGSTGEASSSYNCSGVAANLAAGTVIIAVVNFHGSEGPVTWFQFRMSQP